MKSLQPLEATDSLSLTPSAMRKLSYLAMGGIVVGLFCICVLYLWSCFNDVVSRHRRVMGDAASEARIYFERHEALLEHLGRLSIRDAAMPKQVLDPIRQLPPYQRQLFALGAADGAWGIQLSDRELGDLDRMGAGLLYVSDEKVPQVSYLYGRFERRSVLPEAVLQSLARQVPDGDKAIIWLSAPDDPLRRIYLFQPLSCIDGTAWLGLELRAEDMLEALRADMEGGLILQDAQQRVVLGGENRKSTEVRCCSLEPNSFGFCGSAFLPEFLILNKRLGASGWQLRYYLFLSQLLSPLLLKALGCLLFWGLVLGCGLNLARHIDDHLIRPAQHQLGVLLQQDEFLRAALEVAPVALCLLRCRDAAVVLENQLARQYLGEGHARREENRRWVALAQGSPEGRNGVEVERANGAFMQLSFVPIHYKGEDMLFCACRDIGERKQTERALKDARQLLAETRESKRLFLAAMGREARAPLYLMLNCLESFLCGTLERQQRSNLQSMRGLVFKLLHLLDDVQQVSQVEEGLLVLDQGCFDPLLLLRDVAKAHAQSAFSKGIRFYICCDPQMPRQLRGDATLIRQVLDNLLDNAVRFTENGFVVLRARVLTWDKELLQVLWQVSDTGCGIPSEQQSELFQPFFQTSAGGAAPTGSGLGLTIGQQLVQLLGGTLRVVSQEGLGSSFSVSVPLHRQPDEAVMATLSSLAGQKVCIRCGTGDLRTSLSGWLARYGAQPYPWQPGMKDGLLLDCLLYGERPLPGPGWTAARVIACAQGPEQPCVVDGVGRVSLYDIDAIVLALKLVLRQGRA